MGTERKQVFRLVSSSVQSCFKKSYYHRTQSNVLLSPDGFRDKAPLFDFDCSRQDESFKSSLVDAVSYTHLDVYKRQLMYTAVTELLPILIIQRHNPILLLETTKGDCRTSLLDDEIILVETKYIPTATTF